MDDNPMGPIELLDNAVRVVVTILGVGAMACLILSLEKAAS